MLAGLSASKANFRIAIESVQNPGEVRGQRSSQLYIIDVTCQRSKVRGLTQLRPAERKFVPLTSDPAVPSQRAELLAVAQSGGGSSAAPTSVSSFALPSSPLPPAGVDSRCVPDAPQSEDVAPPRPPLPRCYDYDDAPPEVPPLPKEASVIRHTSVRGLKRQSDERRRDREGGQCVANGDAKVSGCPGANLTRPNSDLTARVCGFSRTCGPTGANPSCPGPAATAPTPSTSVSRAKVSRSGQRSLKSSGFYSERNRVVFPSQATLLDTTRPRPSPPTSH